MRKYFLVFLFLINLYSYCQEIKPTKKYDFAFSPGIILQGNTFNELNLTIGKISTENWTVGIVGWRLGIESNFKYDREFIIAPKIGYDISMTYFTVRLSGINYFQNKNSEFRILPKIGVSLGGSFCLTYGYGISLNKSDISGLSNHRMGLSFNFNKQLNNTFR
ncbi:hypothetical protein [Flavobacterium chungnamense]|uniref:Outer membrane protein beta-barrel domain-containing protein n=1 Tax=Flavobacterium chungnamense TaxID=706182 RepID=A0ABP7UXC9_9FLAO